MYGNGLIRQTCITIDAKHMYLPPWPVGTRFFGSSMWPGTSAWSANRVAGRVAQSQLPRLCPAARPAARTPAQQLFDWHVSRGWQNRGCWRSPWCASAPAWPPPASFLEQARCRVRLRDTTSQRLLTDAPPPPLPHELQRPRSPRGARQGLGGRLRGALGWEGGVTPARCARRAAAAAAARHCRALQRAGGWRWRYQGHRRVTRYHELERSAAWRQSARGAREVC